MATRRDFKVMQLIWVRVLPNGDENEINVIAFAPEFDILFLKNIESFIEQPKAQWKKYWYYLNQTWPSSD